VPLFALDLLARIIAAGIDASRLFRHFSRFGYQRLPWGLPTIAPPRTSGHYSTGLRRFETQF
jgi:hypothetical protein